MYDIYATTLVVDRCVKINERIILRPLDININIPNVDEIKAHLQKNQGMYGFGVGVAVAGITCFIMKGRYSAQRIDRGISVVANRGISVIADRSVVKENVFLISSRRQGAPSWVVRCFETGGIFSSQLSAAKEMNIPASELSKHLNGMMDNVRGFHFERVCLAA